MADTLKETERELQALRKRRAQAREDALESPQAALKAARVEKNMYDEIAEEQARFNKLYDRKVGRTK